MQLHPLKAHWPGCHRSCWRWASGCHTSPVLFSCYWSLPLWNENTKCDHLDSISFIYGILYMPVHNTAPLMHLKNNIGCLANIHVEKFKVLVTLKHSTISVSTSNHYSNEFLLKQQAIILNVFSPPSLIHYRPYHYGLNSIFLMRYSINKTQWTRWRVTLWIELKR